MLHVGLTGHISISNHIGAIILLWNLHETDKSHKISNRIAISDLHLLICTLLNIFYYIISNNVFIGLHNKAINN